MSISEEKKQRDSRAVGDVTLGQDDAVQWGISRANCLPATVEGEPNVAICTVDTVVVIEDDRKLVLQLPPDVTTGRHRVVAMVEEAPATASAETFAEWSFPVTADAEWPDDMPLSRDLMYGDDGR
jgi:hypothetical protein